MKIDNSKRLYIVLFALLAFVAPLYSQKPVKNLKPTVILISLDGFRADYLEKYNPPTLNKLAKEGTRAKWMTPSFPSKTFPNHYAIATGLYPEHNGIIENNIYDFGAIFGLSKREEVQNPRWWLGEPIWVTAEKQGQHAAAFFFPGTETEIQGKRPTFWKEYDGKIPNETRVDTILSWLDLPEKERPTIYTLYFSDADDAGHATSPDSEETKQAVLKVDRDIQRLIDGLKKRKIEKKANIIIVSDHGMAAVKPENFVILDDYYKPENIERVLWTGEIVQIFPKEGKLEETISTLKNASHTQCWKKSDIPARFNYQDSPRIAPIICSSEESWAMMSKERYESQKTKPEYNRVRGAHGYDNQLASMRAVFIAHGKAFREGKIVEPFENVNVYNMMTKILRLNPAKNDGSMNIADKVVK